MSLDNYLTGKTKTLMIGAIAAFEEQFKDDIGLSKADADRTPEEKKLYDKFMVARSKILDLGNLIIKKIKLELQLYKVRGPYYKYTFTTQELEVKTIKPTKE